MTQCRSECFANKFSWTFGLYILRVLGEVDVNKLGCLKSKDDIGHDANDYVNDKADNVDDDYDNDDDADDDDDSNNVNDE